MKRISSSSTPTQPPPPPSPEHLAISNHNPIPRKEKKKEKEKEKKKAKTKTKTKKQLIERKVKEKIRRERLKKLYSTLASLLPLNPRPSMERMTTPEMVGEAVEYIKTLQRQLKEAEEKKLVSTFQGGRRLARNDHHTAASGSMITPKMEIQELGSGLEVVLITGLEHQFMFHEVIRILHQETMEVLNANFSILGDTIYHTVHGKTEESMFCFRADKIREKLNRLVGQGMSCDDDEEAGKYQDQAHDQPQQQQQLMWDNEIPFDNWDFTFHH